MNMAEQLSWAKASSQEGINSADQVPQGDSIEVVNHIGRDAVDAWVKALWYLPTDKAGHRHAARHAHLRASGASDLPFFTVEVRSCALDVSNEGARGVFIRHGKGHVTLKVDGGQLRREVVHQWHVRAVVVVVLTHANIREHFVVEAVVDVFFGDFFTIGIKPCSSSVIPGNQASRPRQFDDASSA